MKKIIKARGDGKTTDLIQLSHETGAYIVCRSQETCSMISAMAREQKLDIPFPITYQEFLEGRYGMRISGFLIDDADELLQRLSRVPIDAITMTPYIYTMKNEEYFDIGLPKWPALIVKGEKVTEEQAAEIIIRTSGWLSCNDHEFANSCNEVLYDAKIPDEHKPYYDGINKGIEAKLGLEEKDWREIYAYREEKEKELGIIKDLQYLGNDRVCSSWIGGPHGWCDWDGTIECHNYNIGKWPTVEEVYNEWKKIAKAFPFLDLRCQLANHEASSPEMDPNPRPVIEFIVKNGKVRMTIPKDYITEPEFGPMRNVFDNGTEIGCTLETFTKSVNIVREKMGLKQD